MIYDVKPAVGKTLEELRDQTTLESLNNDLTTHLGRFIVSDPPDGAKVLTSSFKSPGDALRNVDNRHESAIIMSYLQHLSTENTEKALSEKKVVATKIMECLEGRFDDYNKPIIQAMNWLDPVNWQADRKYGMADIEKLYSHFQETLDAANFDQRKAIKEWIGFRVLVSESAVLQKHQAAKLWERILLHKRDEFPNVCLLVELVICILGSNSLVECAFSLLTRMLSDQRLRTNHAAMSMRLRLKINDDIWSKDEREILCALEIYLQKRHKVTLEVKDTDNPVTKKSRLAITDEEQVTITSDEDDDTESVSSWEESESDVEN